MKDNRIVYIDLLRTTAIILMVLSHAIAFLYSGGNPVLRFIQYIGDSAAFTLFLFTSGLTAYYAYLKTNEDKKEKLFRRFLILIGVFYLISFVSSIENIIVLNSTIEKFWYIFDLLTLKQMGDYSEFLLPFAFFVGIIALFPNLLKLAISNKLTLIIVSVGVYFLGYGIYNINFGSDLDLYKAIFSGHDNLYRFPLLQYFPVFLFGLFYGKILDNNARNFSRDLIIDSLGCSLILLIAFFSTFVASIPYFEAFNRWPPSIAFLAIGLVMGLAIIIASIKLTKIPIWISSIGQNSIGIFLTHIVILEIYKLTSGVKTENIPLLLIIIIIFVWGVTQIPYRRFNNRG
jgi:uncharacterized membrane protein